MTIESALKHFTSVIGIAGKSHVSDTEVKDVHVDDFFFDPNYLDTHTRIPGLGVVGLTPQGDIRVDSEQLLKIAKMGLGQLETESVGDGHFLIHTRKGREDNG